MCEFTGLKLYHCHYKVMDSFEGRSENNLLRVSNYSDDVILQNQYMVFLLYNTVTVE